MQPAEDRRSAVAEVAALVEIEPILDRYPSSISGGQQQRAILARALVRPADSICSTSRWGSSSRSLRAVLRGRLKSLLVERGMTSIFVTHDQTEANALADRIAVMEGGVLQQFANQKELKERPANLFVATFIGEPPMNVFDADVVNAERVRFASPDGPTLDLCRHRTCRSRAQSAIGKRGPSRDRRAAACRAARRRAATRRAVVSNQWLGDQSHLALDVGGQADGRGVACAGRGKAGRDVALQIAAADLHVFDAESGARGLHGLAAPEWTVSGKDSGDEARPSLIGVDAGTSGHQGGRVHDLRANRSPSPRAPNTL